MPITENTPQRLVLRSGSTTLTLDKDAGTASLGRKMLFFNLKPVALPHVRFHRGQAGRGEGSVSGAIVSHTMLVARSGTAWVFAVAEGR